jgi:hypothetical protein
MLQVRLILRLLGPVSAVKALYCTEELVLTRSSPHLDAAGTQTCDTSIVRK